MTLTPNKWLDPNFTWQQFYLNCWLKMLSPIPGTNNFTATVEKSLTFQKMIAQTAVELQAMGIEAAMSYQLIWLDNYFDNLSILLSKDLNKNQIE